MIRPKPLKRRAGVSMLVFGWPGVGKTRLAGSDGWGRCLILRPPTDSTNSLAGASHVEEIVVPDYAGLLEAQQYVYNEGHKEFDWVWMDSISLFQDFGMDDVMGDAIARKPARAVDKGGVKIPEFGPDKGEYKINMDRIAKFVRDTVGVAGEGKFNFGITAHPFEWHNPIIDEEVLAPWIQGKGMVTKICGYMNIVAYLLEVRKKDKGKQLVLLSEAEGFYGKDEFHCFPELKSGKRGVVNPTMGKLKELIVDGSAASSRRRIKKVKGRK